MLLILIGLAVAGCDRKAPPEGQKSVEATPDAAGDPCESVPCVPVAAQSQPCEDTGTDDIPRFAANSPFDPNYETPLEIEDGKRLWARSALWEEAPELLVEKWLTEKPETEGKCVLIEFWATWCPPCRRSITLLNQFHRKFGEDLVVIGISDETEQDVRKLTDPQPEYPLAIDTQHRTKDALGVSGVPHIIILEPGGYVVWEGFPYLKGYELTDEVIEKILQVAREERG